ncbi:UPF0481 protein At3g47200-like [Prosopis cineraria]|uniref:UPF0481 protein At3g47200-like n=1 Tax=Prosopis cineraria TaxID=364024 RepID=UPI00240FF574|nr:UPF0481 protein At3g47200-like [Prosopis cineraria]
MSDITQELEEIHQQPPQQVEDEVTIDIKTMIQDSGNGNLLPECCIYKVPPPIRDLKPKAYTPQVVSIGPFHHGNERLLEMEKHKQIMFKRFTQRVKRFTQRTMVSLDDLVRHVKKLEPKVRASYSEHINLTEQGLVKLTLMDAGFIIELFIMFYEGREGKIINNDAKLSQQWLVNALILDLLLLENQLPLFIIEELFNKALSPSITNLPEFRVLTYEFFKFHNHQNLEPTLDLRIKHFTDLLRLFNVQRTMPPESSFREVENHVLLYNASALQEAGIKFKDSMSKCLLDLKFSGHILEIPKILVEDRTELLFRNMIALEQCHYLNASYITNYALVLDCLINTNKDMDLLIHNNIVNNIMVDSNEVAMLFNGLCKNVIHLNFNSEYLDICKRLNGFCQDPRNKMKATLRRDYCRTPWQIVASIAVIVLLILTLVQTICSILQVAYIED